MKRTRFCVMLATFGLVSLWATSALAQQEAEGKSQGDSASQEAAKANTEPADGQSGVREGKPSPTRNDRSRLDPATRYRISTLLKLQSAMKQEFELSAEQGDAIDAMFRDQIQVLKEIQESRQSALDDPQKAAKVKELRKQIAAAREADDAEAMRRLREEFKETLWSSKDGPEMNMAQFVSAVAAKLDEKNRPEFRKLARNLGATNVLPNQSNRDLFMMRRAIALPEVGIPESVQKELKRVFQEARISIGEVQGDEAKVTEILESVHQEISERLTTEERNKFEDALANPFRGARHIQVAPVKKESTPDEPPADDKGTKKEEKKDD